MTYAKSFSLAAFVLLFAFALFRSGDWVTAIAQTTEPSRFPSGIDGLTENHVGPPGNNWLLGAVNDAERFRRLQIYAGGTDQQMWQIGYRYEQVYQAIIDENWELGIHHWGKLRDVFNVALMKRPNRTPNAETLFLNDTWQVLAAALENEDTDAAREAFLMERQACMSCHVAEGFAFINGMHVFAETAAFPQN